MGLLARRVRRNSTRRTMALLWVGFTLAYFAFFYVFQDASEIADSSLDGYLEVILLGIPTVVLLAGTVWVRESSVDEDLRSRVPVWTVTLALLFVVAMYTALFVIETRFDPGEQWLILLLSLGFGASSGAVMGVLQAKSKQRERERNRSIRVAERRERQRSQLEYLNQYLRHEVLNEVNKINGYAALVSETRPVDGEAAAYLDVIRHSSEDVATFIESIRTILDASDHDPELAPVDVMAVLEAETAGIESTAPEATVEVTGPETAPVLAGDLLERVFRNLVENAIEHNEGEVAVSVAVSADRDWVTVRVRDDGDGVPPAKRDRLFEPPESGDHGYGLFLTRNLVEMYGGRLELGATGPEGTEFVVRLAAEQTRGVPSPATRPRVRQTA